MEIRFKPWTRREAVDGSIEKETALAILVRPVGSDPFWVPKAGVENVQQIVSAKRSAESFVKSDDVDGPVVYTLPPWNHQKVGYAYVMKQWDAGEGCLLEFKMGCGKTKITIDVLQNRRTGTVLIVCPKSVVMTWEREFQKHAVPGRFEVLPLSKYTVAKRAQMAVEHINRAALRGKTPVIVINYESVWRPDFSPALQSIDVLVADESQRLKSAQGQASKFLAKLATKIPHRIGLTGTPMPHSPLDIYAQYKILCPSVFGTRHTTFKARYAVMGGFQGHQVIGYQNEAELRQKYLSHALQCSRDVLDLPPEVHVVRDVELEPATMRIYKEMDRDLIACVKDGTVTAANALSRLLRLAQITGGSVPMDEGNATRVGTEKQDVLQEVLDDLASDEPVVVFCRFHADLDAVHAASREAGRASLELSGRKNELAQWQAGGAPVLAVQIQAGGVGIDLTRACYVVYYSVGYSLAEWQQSLARAHRPGQTRTVTFIRLVARGTIDEKIYRAIEDKKNIVESIIGELTTQT